MRILLSKIVGIFRKKKNNTFYIKMQDSWFNKNDVLEFGGSSSRKVRVLKVYKQNWWRKLLLRLGLKVRMMQLKVEPYNENII